MIGDKRKAKENDVKKAEHREKNRSKNQQTRKQPGPPLAQYPGQGEKTNRCNREKVLPPRLQINRPGRIAAPANFRSIQAVANPETIARKTKGIKGRKSRFHCKRPRFHQNRTGSTTTAMATMAFANNPRQNNNKANAYALQVLVRSNLK